MEKIARQTPHAEVGRRTALRSGLFFGLGCGLGLMDTPPAHAAKEFTGRTITFASWGGAYQDAQVKAYCDPFGASTGATVLQDEPMDFAKLRTMVKMGHPVWDVADVTMQFLVDAEKGGLFAPINPNVVHVDRTRPEYHNEYGVADCVWSSNIAYSASAFPNGNGPSSWPEVFDVKRFPGTRTLEDRVSPTLEIALLADGLTPDTLYPLDVDRAFRKLDTVRKHTTFWTTDAQAEELFTDGDVICGMIANGRAYNAVQKGAKITLVWNQHAETVEYPRGTQGQSKRRCCDAPDRCNDSREEPSHALQPYSLFPYESRRLQVDRQADASVVTHCRK